MNVAFLNNGTVPAKRQILPELQAAVLPIMTLKLFRPDQFGERLINHFHTIVSIEEYKSTPMQNAILVLILH